MEYNINNIPAEKFQFAKKNDLMHDSKLETKPVGYFQGAFRRFCKNKGAVVGGIVIAVLVLFAIIAPFFTPFQPAYYDMVYAYVTPKNNLFANSNIDFWDDAPRLRRYLLTCVRNEIVKLQSKAVYWEDIDLHVNTLVSDDDFIHAVDEEEDYHRLVASIRKLPERYGHMMYLRWVEGMTVKQIAERTEMQTATVYKTLERGKLLLLKQLREDGIWIAQMQPN